MRHKIDQKRSTEYKKVLLEWFDVIDGMSSKVQSIDHNDVIQHLEQDHLYSVLLKGEQIDHVVTVVGFSQTFQDENLQVWYKDPLIENPGLKQCDWNSFVDQVKDAYFIIGVK